jgi:hypothetical protein
MTVETALFWVLVGAALGSVLGHLKAGRAGAGLVIGALLGPLFGTIAIMLFLTRDGGDMRQVISPERLNQPERRP